MTLRELKRSGGFLLPDSRGAWCHFHEGESPRCPYPDCRRAFAGRIAEGRIVSTRIYNQEPNPALLYPMTCRNCKREFQVAA
jgi:hypothetical protein